MKYRLCEKGWKSGKSRSGRQRKQGVWTHRTIASIFFLYFGSISFRYSGLISMAAKLNDEFFSPARWHSMTADVRMGTTSTPRWTPFRLLLDSFWPSFFEINLMLNGGFCVDLRAGNLLILLLTRMSMRAPFRWSPLFTWIYIITTHQLSSQENCTHAILTLRGFIIESKQTCPSHFINRLTKDAACSCADFCFCNSGQYRAIECDQ